jgi:hypothetical protein
MLKHVLQTRKNFIFPMSSPPLNAALEVWRNFNVGQGIIKRFLTFPTFWRAIALRFRGG